jgi:hypothetical protein
MQRRCSNCTTESAGPSEILFQRPARFTRSDSFSLDVRRFDQRGPFLDPALNKFLGAQESCRAHTPAHLTPAQQSAAVVSGAEKLSSRHVLPGDLSNALKQLDDGELDRLFAATRHELQCRGRLLTSTPVTRPTTHMGTEQRPSDQSTTTEESPERRQPEEPNVALAQGQVNAVRAAFKAGITPSRIARQFGISQSDVRKVLASESPRSGKGR